MKTKARVIAFYLPQYHPVDVNNKFWGKGFTEWTNVAKAKPCYKGHYQPQIPADLGFYDLRLPEVRKEQAQMAEEAGIEGFCYWYYRFDKNTRVLEMPINEIMRLKEPDFPFCIGWANHDWSNKTWKKTKYYSKDIVFLKQKYLGSEDYKAFFNEVLPMFQDNRYILVDGKPLFYIFAPQDIPDTDVLIKVWNTLAKENGFPGVYFVCRVDSCGKAPVIYKKSFLEQGLTRYQHYIEKGFNAVNSYSFRRAEVLAEGYISKIIKQLKRKLTGHALNRCDYERVMDNLYTDEDRFEYVFPTIMPRHDRTPRSGKNANLYSDSTPEKFAKAANRAVNIVAEKNEEHRIIFLDSWNEWGEGAYMEPDIVFGYGYLEALKKVISYE
ncbi:MAG: lipopolysaccharide biosynthesis protein [Lachnospiraceae bacterium]|jgi:hypothetical protein|nr:lipopolysaccharide biosynthesis protein [Lachnospiraceae bacterium]